MAPIALIVLAVGAGPAHSTDALAEDYPNKPVRFVNSGVAGSIPDSVARPLADRLAAHWGQPVVVDNRPGAGGIVAMTLVAKAKPDGYTIGMATMTQLVFNQYLFEKLPYDPVHDITPVIKLVTGKVVIVANPSLPANTVQELIALAKARPGKIDYAIPQLATPPHVFALVFAREAQIDMVAVPFRSGAEAVAQIIAGEVPLGFDAALVLAPHVKAGKLKALAVIGRERDPLLPDVPTLAELGFPDITHEGWLGVVVPAGVPPAIVRILNEAIARELRSPEMKKHFEDLGWHVHGGSPEEFTAANREERLLWRRVIREAGLKLD